MMVLTESAVKCNNNNQAVVCLLYKKKPWHFQVDKDFFEKNEEKKALSISLITRKQLTPNDVKFYMK